MPPPPSQTTRARERWSSTWPPTVPASADVVKSGTIAEARPPSSDGMPCRLWMPHLEREEKQHSSPVHSIPFQAQQPPDERLSVTRNVL